jgi:hypothetical protein
MIAGCSIRLSTPPRLSARVKKLRALQHLAHAGEVALEHGG